MKSDPPPPKCFVHWPAAAEPQDHRRECGTDVHCGHPADNDMPPWYGFVAGEPRHEILADIKEPGPGPGEPIAHPSSDRRRGPLQHSLVSFFYGCRGNGSQA